MAESSSPSPRSSWVARLCPPAPLRLLLLNNNHTCLILQNRVDFFFFKHCDSWLVREILYSYLLVMVSCVRYAGWKQICWQQGARSSVQPARQAGRQGSEWHSPPRAQLFPTTAIATTFSLLHSEPPSSCCFLLCTLVTKQVIKYLPTSYLSGSSFTMLDSETFAT